MLDQLPHRSIDRLIQAGIAPRQPSMTAGIGIGTGHIGATLVRAASTPALVLLPYIRARYLQRREIDALSL